MNRNQKFSTIFSTPVAKCGLNVNIWISLKDVPFLFLHADREDITGGTCQACPTH